MKIEFLFRALKTLIVTRRSADMGVGETQKVKASGEKKGRNASVMFLQERRSYDELCSERI